MAGGLIEIYAEIAVDMADDPKVRALARFGRSARPARDLYVQMILYCKKTLSDGFVPDEQIGVLVYPDSPAIGAREAKQLAEVGLIQRLGRGWHVVAFLKRNKSRADVESGATDRAEEGARGNHYRWHVRRGVVSERCPYCVADRSGTRSPDDRPPDGVPDPHPIASGFRSESTETETETKTNDRTPKESVGARGAKSTRGTRLPDDFEPTPEMVEWARDKAPLAARVDHEAFCDHWRAQPGQRGVKVDWPATWRNWMRREQEKRSNGRRGDAPRPSTTDQRVGAGLQLAEELRAEERGLAPQRRELSA